MATISNTPIHNLSPHYTNSHYKEARTVWLKDGYTPQGRYNTVPGVEYNYSDRLWQWERDKADKAWESVDRNQFTPRSSAFLQEWLRGYFDNPNLELVHILAGFNLGSGYPYQVYGYISHKEQAAQNG